MLNMSTDNQTRFEVIFKALDSGDLIQEKVSLAFISI